MVGRGHLLTLPRLGWDSSELGWEGQAGQRLAQQGFPGLEALPLTSCGAGSLSFLVWKWSHPTPSVQ